MTNNGQQAIMSKDNNTPAVTAPTTTPPKSDRRVGVFFYSFFLFKPWGYLFVGDDDNVWKNVVGKPIDLPRKIVVSRVFIAGEWNG